MFDPNDHHTRFNKWCAILRILDKIWFFAISKFQGFSIMIYFDKLNAFFDLVNLPSFLKSQIFLINRLPILSMPPAQVIHSNYTFSICRSIFRVYIMKSQWFDARRTSDCCSTLQSIIGCDWICSVILSRNGWKIWHTISKTYCGKRL